MKELGAYFTEHPIACTSYFGDVSIELFQYARKDDDLSSLRDYVTSTPPIISSNPYAALSVMGLVESIRNSSARHTFKTLNSDFLIATHYIDDPLYAQRLDARIGIAALLDRTKEVFVDHYFKRATDAVKVLGGAVDLTSVVATTALDCEYWLEEDSYTTALSDEPNASIFSSTTT